MSGVGDKRGCPGNTDNACLQFSRLSDVVERERLVAIRERDVAVREFSLNVREGAIALRESTTVKYNGAAAQAPVVQASVEQHMPALTATIVTGDTLKTIVKTIVTINTVTESEKSRQFVAHCMNTGLRVYLVRTSTGEAYHLGMNTRMVLGACALQCGVVCTDTTGPQGASRISRKHCVVCFDRTGLKVEVLGGNGLYVPLAIGGGDRCLIKPPGVMYLDNTSIVELLIEGGVQWKCPVGLGFHFTAS